MDGNEMTTNPDNLPCNECGMTGPLVEETECGYCWDPSLGP